MYIAVLFTWTLMAATRALKMTPSCSELCNSYDNYVNSRRVDCICVEPVKQTDVSSSSEIRDKGIYYLPAGSDPKQRILFPFSNLNFNIQNPITKSNQKPNLERFQLYGKNADLSVLKSEDHDEKKIEKHKQSDAYDEDVEITSRKPIYIDIEINKMETSESFSGEDKDSTIYQRKETYLQECTDIRTILQSRRSNSIPELREKWGTEKLDRYINLSDTELLKESNAKCTYPNIVKIQTMNEIKQTLPTKFGGSKLHVKNSVNYHSYSKVLPDMSVHVKSSSTGKFVNNDKSNTSTVVVTEREHETPYEPERNTLKVVNAARPYGDWFREIDANETSYISSNEIKDIQREISNNTVTDLAKNDQYNEDVPLNNLKDIEHIENYFTAGTSLPLEIGNNTTVKTTIVTNCDTCTEADFTTTSYPDVIALDTISTDAVTSDVLFTKTTSTVSPTTNAALITTKSTSNEGVSGETALSTYETTTEVSIRDYNSMITSESNLLVEDATITGGIYFNFGNQNIPARFIQDPTGLINISIDVIKLCDKLNLSSNGSVLIGVMCKCVQFKTCT